MLRLKKAVRSTPALEGRDLALQRQFRDYPALAVARRHGLDTPDDYAAIVAAMAQAGRRLAADEWADTDGQGDIQAIMRRHFDLANRIVAPPASSAPRRRLVPKANKAAR